MVRKVGKKNEYPMCKNDASQKFSPVQSTQVFKKILKIGIIESLVSWKGY